MTDTVSLIIAIVSAVLAIVSAGFSCFTYFRNVIHDRRRDTLDAYNTLQNEAFDKLNKMKPANIREIAENPRSDSYKTVSGTAKRSVPESTRSSRKSTATPIRTITKTSIRCSRGWRKKTKSRKRS